MRSSPRCGRCEVQPGSPTQFTLLFARSAYAAVAEAYLEALEERAEEALPIDRSASVASFFVRRIDTLIDARLDARLAEAPPAERPRLEGLRGRIAIANAKLAYRHYQGIVERERWGRLAARGAHPQRLLWASTSTKNPTYRDTLYVEELIGPETVDTIPPETLEAFRDHGIADETLTDAVEEAAAELAELERLGVSLDRATDELLADGIAKFVAPYRKLLDAVATRSRALVEEAG